MTEIKNMANSIPAPRVETFTITWLPVEGPIRCTRCRHDHYGWIITDSDTTLVHAWKLRSGNGYVNGGGALAPQWGWCDQEDCPCRSLEQDRRKLHPVDEDPAAPARPVRPGETQ